MEDPYVMNLEFQISPLSNTHNEHSKEYVHNEIYGEKFSKEAYFSLFVGKLKPKVFTKPKQEPEEEKSDFETGFLESYSILQKKVTAEANLIANLATKEDTKETEILDPEILKIVNSKTVTEAIEMTNDDYVNTFIFT